MTSFTMLVTIGLIVMIYAAMPALSRGVSGQ